LLVIAMPQHEVLMLSTVVNMLKLTQIYLMRLLVLRRLVVKKLMSS
jgi:hypothetical protein